MKTVARIAVAVLGLSCVMGCSTLRSLAAATPASPKGSAKSAKEIAACEKMCAVAGDAEDNKAAVDNCKKKCQAK